MAAKRTSEKGWSARAQYLVSLKYCVGLTPEPTAVSPPSLIGIGSILGSALLGVEDCSRYLLRRCGLRVLRLPAHGGGDAGASAGMIEEHELLDWTRVEF